MQFVLAGYSGLGLTAGRKMAASAEIHIGDLSTHACRCQGEFEMRRTRILKDGSIMTVFFILPGMLEDFKGLCAIRKTTVSAELRKFIERQNRRAFGGQQ